MRIHTSFQVNETGLHIKENELGIPAFDMSMESMTTKMAWLLAQGKSYEKIKLDMITDLHGEISVDNEMI